MFQRIKNKLLLGSVLGLGWAMKSQLRFRPYFGLSTSFCASTDSDLQTFGMDVLVKTAAAMIALQAAPKITWDIYKNIWNHLYDECIVNSYINDNDEYINEDNIAAIEEAFLDDEESDSEVEEKPEIESKNPLQARLDAAHFDGQLPNGAMDVSTRDILNKPKMLIPCGHSHSADQIQHFNGKCPCCRGSFTQAVPNYNLHQLLSEVVDNLVANTEKKAVSRVTQNPFAFYQLKDQVTETRNTNSHPFEVNL